MSLLKWVLASTLMVTTLAACGSKNHQKVDAANSDVTRMGDIDQSLRDKKIFISSSKLSAATIGSTDETELNAVDTLLAEFVNRGQNVVRVSSQKGVKDKDNLRDKVQAWLAGAQELQGMIQKEREHRKELSDDKTSDKSADDKKSEDKKPVVVKKPSGKKPKKSHQS